MKTLLIGMGVLIVIIGGVWFWAGKAQPATIQSILSDYKNATYIIEGKPVTLVNGRAESLVASNSASTVVTQYFGNEATGDLNGDGMPDIAFVLTQTGGGSGTFYYVVTALKTANGYQGTNGVLLGDRIAPQSTQINNGQIVVNYADRATGEPMATAPSVGVSKYLQFANGVLSEILVNSDRHDDSTY